MKIKYSNELAQRLEFPGLAEVKMKHKVSETEADLVYTGPRIERDQWNQVLSFFRWTYKEAHSESQVRGFIDPVDNKVIFWAFPQEAGTGMTTREIPGDDFDQQRLALPHAGELIYFITVHHHCGMSAFQSGGDSNNEERPSGGAHESGQDGLHITIGKMDEPRHDIDVRFYLQRAKIIPEMGIFWDIGKEVRDLLPPSMHNSVALFQMCQKVEAAFPEAWKENYRRPARVEVRTTGSTTYHYDGGMGYGVTGRGNKSLTERIKDSAFELVDELMRDPCLEVKSFKEVVAFLMDSTIVDSILDLSMKEHYDGFDIRTLIKEMDNSVDEWEDSEIEAACGQQSLIEDARTGTGVDNGVNKRKSKKQRKRELAEAARKAIEDAKVSVASAALPAVTGEPKHGDLNEARSAHWDADRRSWIEFGEGY